MEGGASAERSGDGIGDEDLLCGAGGVGAGDGGDVVHHVGIVIFGDEAEAHLRDAVAAREPAAEGLALKRLDRHHPDVVRPGLERFAHAGDGACATHADHDAVHKAPALPRDGFGDGGAGDAAVVFGVVVVGEPVHIVPAVLRSLALGQRPRTGQTVPGRGVQNLGTEAEQILLPQGRGILRHGDHDGVPGGAAGQSQCRRKGTGGSLDDGLAGGQCVLLCRKGQHPFGQRITGRAGGAVKVQVGVQPPLQPAGRKVAPQLHDGAGQQGLVKVRINGHEIPPSVGYIIIILTQSGRGVKPHFGKNGENPRKNLAE